MGRTPPPLLEPETLAEAAADVVLVHVATADAYARAHLPDARLVEPRQLVRGTPPAPGELPDPAQLEALFSTLGYSPEQHLVVYDDEGGGWAGRFIWTLDLIGHGRWSYLNGGLEAWRESGGELAHGPPSPVTPTAVSLTIDAAAVARFDDVLAAIGDSDTIIWDVRSAAEFRGEKSGSRRAGHIPGAVNIDWMRLKDPARQLRLVDDLESLLGRHGIVPDRQVITHCQTHHRSGLSYLVLRLLGFPHVRAYPGSWAEWGNRDDTPVERGGRPPEGSSAA